MSKTVDNANPGLWQRIKSIFTRGADEPRKPTRSEDAKAAAPAPPPVKPTPIVASEPAKAEPPASPREKAAEPPKPAARKPAKAKTAKSKPATASASKAKSPAKPKASPAKAAAKQPERSKAELLEEARRRDIAGRSSMTKAELERALRPN